MSSSYSIGGLWEVFYEATLTPRLTREAGSCAHSGSGAKALGSHQATVLRVTLSWPPPPGRELPGGKACIRHLAVTLGWHVSGTERACAQHWAKDAGKLIVLFSLCKQIFPTPSPAQPVSSALPVKCPFPSLNDGDAREGGEGDGFPKCGHPGRASH